MSRKHESSLKVSAEAMNEAKMKAKLARIVTTESTMEGSSTMTISDDLPAPTSIGQDYSSDDGDACDENYKGTLTSDDTSVIYSDQVSKMKRIDKQKVAMMLYDNYVERMRLQKTEAAKKVRLFLGASDKTVRLWRRIFMQRW